MRGFQRKDHLEARLRAERPQPRAEFLASVADRIGSAERVHGRARGLRFAFAGGLTAAMLVALAAVGGLGYAASSVSEAVHAVTKVVAPAKAGKPTASASSAAAQYGAKVTLCHKGHKITVAQSAVPAHLRQGDTRPVNGKCPAGKFRPAGSRRSGVNPRATG